jgi:hypothetical protein
MAPRTDDSPPRRAPTYAIALLPFVLVALAALAALAQECRASASVHAGSDVRIPTPDGAVARSAADP